MERLRDTEMALGSDLMVAGTEGYALLKVTGGQQGLDAQLREIGARWGRGVRRGANAPELEPVEA